LDVSRSVFGSGSTDPGNLMFLLNSGQNFRAFRHLNFETPSRGSKVMAFLSVVQMLAQKLYFLANLAMFLLFLKMGSVKNGFLDNKCQTLMSSNF